MNSLFHFLNEIIQDIWIMVYNHKTFWYLIW